MNIGDRIRSLREKSGYTQNALAERAGISQTHLRRVELGQADITVRLLQVVCDTLEISLKDFFSVSEEAEELSAALSGLTPRQKKLLIDFLKSL